MMRDQLRYLSEAGFTYKPAESPDLWTHLESCFANPDRIGPRFNYIPSAFVTDLIAKGEVELVSAMVSLHRRTGRLEPVAQVIELPYVVGTVGILCETRQDKTRALRLVDRPGSPGERLIQVMPVEADAIPCTNKITMTGGPYADGHTAGYYSLYPGQPQDHTTDGATPVYLVTDQLLGVLAQEMEQKLDDIVTVTQAETRLMLERIRRLLG